MLNKEIQGINYTTSKFNCEVTDPKSIQASMQVQQNSISQQSKQNQLG
jgi:hypothetical protein